MSWRLGAVLTLLAPLWLAHTPLHVRGDEPLHSIPFPAAPSAAQPEFPPLVPGDSDVAAAVNNAQQPPQPFVELTGLHLQQLIEESVDSQSPYAPYHQWQLLPPGLIFRSYLAGEKEPRFAAQWLWDKNEGLVWESALGGRWGIVRYGTPGPIQPEGFQLDVEGAALARVLPEEESDLGAVDFRAGIVGTWRIGPWRSKAGYYHLSSHIGDEFLVKNPSFVRINYVRDAILAALMYDLTDELQIYGEVAYAFNANGGAEPMELQFGAQFSDPLPTGPHGAPFAAVNCHWRQEFSRELSVNILAGWMWRGRNSDHIFRAGFQHYNGRALQYELFDKFESLTGLGIWFDF